VLDSVLAHKAVCVENHGDEHVSWELVYFEEIQKDDEELVQGVLNFRKGMGGEVFAVVFLNPRYAQLKKDLACEGGVWAESEGLHGSDLFI